MIRIVDSTLAMLDHYLPTKAQLLRFCECMKQIGIVDIEISTKIYEIIKPLPTEFRFYLMSHYQMTQHTYPGIYKFILMNNEQKEGIISQFQINDMREVMQLRPYKACSSVRIVGLDDLICHNYTYVMKEIREIFKESQINFCPENTYHCATALAIEWLQGGGKEVTTSFAGIGNRAATEEVIMGLRVNSHYKLGQKLTSLIELKEVAQEILQKDFSKTKPVIGSDIFWVESGIHVDGIMKKASNYMPYAPEEVGLKTKIIIGKHSGRTSIEVKLKEYGIESMDQSMIAHLLQLVKEVSMRERRSLSDEAFLSLVKEVMQSERREKDS